MTQVNAGMFDLLHEGNLGKPNILVLTEYVNATYFISFDAPLGAMYRRGELNFAVACQARVDGLGSEAWTVLRDKFRPDLLVLTRYGLPSGLEIMRQAQEAGVPAIYHIDDDLLDLPASLGADIKKRNGSSLVKEARRQMLMHASLVYASTAVLAERMQGRFPRQKIFHGIYASYPGDATTPSSSTAGDGSLTIGYMGSRGHVADLELAVPAIRQLLIQRPKLRFETFGTIGMPQTLVSFGARVVAHPVSKSYNAFLGQLSRLSWAVGLAPLVDEPFNRCKAPTKFIEYASAGIPIVASDTAVYRDVISKSGGGVLVNNDWESSIDAVIASPGKGAAMVASARGYCRSHFAPELLEAQLRAVMVRVGMEMS